MLLNRQYIFYKDILLVHLGVLPASFWENKTMVLYGHRSGMVFGWLGMGISSARGQRGVSMYLCILSHLATVSPNNAYELYS